MFSFGRWEQALKNKFFGGRQTGCLEMCVFRNVSGGGECQPHASWAGPRRSASRPLQPPHGPPISPARHCWAGAKNDGSETRFALVIADIALCLPYKTSPLAISPARGFYPDECARLPPDRRLPKSNLSVSGNNAVAAGRSELQHSLREETKWNRALC